MTHDDNSVPPADDATTPLPEAFIDPTPQADTPAVDAIPFEDPATPDEAPLPEMALEALASPEETPVPEERGHSSFAPEDPSSADPTMTAIEESPLSSSAQAPPEAPADSLLTEPAPADLAAIAAVASLSTPQDSEETNSDESYFSSHEDPLPSSTLHSRSSPSSATLTPPRRVLSGGWTMGLLLSGIAIIAACVLIPQGDETRKLMYERESLRADLEQVQKQVTTNDEFLKKVQSDPTLAERLAQRQMKLVPAGTKVLDVDDASPTKDDKSPFLIVSVPPPAPMPPYHPRGGAFAQMCRNGRSQLYMIGGGLMLVAAGLVLGVSGTSD